MPGSRRTTPASKAQRPTFARAAATAARRGVAFSALLIVAAALAGCSVAGIEAAYLIRDEKAYRQNIDAAVSGDPQAQYEVGKSRCCGVGGETDMYYNTRAATSWLCASARQGYGPAMHQLGQIYSGAAIEPWRLIRQGLEVSQDPPTNNALAYVWYEKARANGYPEAGVRSFEVRPELSARQVAIATALLEDGRRPPCDWDDVMEPGYLQALSEPL